MSRASCLNVLSIFHFPAPRNLKNTKKSILSVVFFHYFCRKRCPPHSHRVHVPGVEAPFDGSECEKAYYHRVTLKNSKLFFRAFLSFAESETSPKHFLWLYKSLES